MVELLKSTEYNLIPKFRLKKRVDAINLYIKLGFKRVEENETDYHLRKEL
jgi:ribosomal protein S18 acetylase RimI-like enzyme